MTTFRKLPTAKPVRKTRTGKTGRLCILDQIFKVSPLFFKIDAGGRFHNTEMEVKS